MRAVTIPESGGRRPYAVPRIELGAEGIVEGDVVDLHGDPIAGARVARDHVPTWLLVGSNPEGMAVADAKGHFTLHELPEGSVALEAYAPDVGRGRCEGVKIVAGRTTENVRIVVAPGASEQSAQREPAASGGVAVTLGETGAPTEVLVISVVDGSEAERAGFAPGDVLLAVDGASVHTMDEARAKLTGALADDIVVRVRRGDRTLALHVAREVVRR
jgi:membrane-associated protease RseP (regulator of RpoE activity)